MKKQSTKTIYVVGHKSPDTDTVCSAIAYAEYLKKKGKKAVAARTGEINPETKFVLNYFKLKTPKLISSAKGKKLILLDHNEKSQSPNDIEKAEIIEVIDHHKIKFEYKEPILFHAEPIGSTSTIIARKYFNDKKINLKKEIAGILLGAILSDTVIFKSPTTTKQDIGIAKKLAKLAKIKKIKEFGIEIKKEKASLKGMTAKDILYSDFKEYIFGKIKIMVGQVEVVTLDEVEKRKQELLEKIKQVAKKNNYNLVILMATDIIKQGSLLLFFEKENYIKKVFGKKPKNNSVYIKGIISRKKQVIPPLTKLFSKK